MNISKFKGKTFTEIQGMEVGSKEILFKTRSHTFKMYHEQDCCENVRLEDVCGDVKDLIGTPIVNAYEESSQSTGPNPSYDYGSTTWTFYRLATIKGTVTLRWLGRSNGYYSESVDIVKCN